MRDLVLLQENGHTRLTADGETRQLRLGVATKAQADQASRSLWLPNANEYYSGLILLFDEVDRMASVGGRAEKLATDTLREVIDRTREDLPGAMFVYAVPPQFMNDVVPKYPALQQRVRTPGRFSHINHFSPLISLDHLDVDENDLMLGIGEKLIPIYETAFDVQLDHTIQRANAVILANVARDVFDEAMRHRILANLVSLLPSKEISDMVERIIEEVDELLDTPFLRKMRQKAITLGLEEGHEKGRQAGREEGIRQSILDTILYRFAPSEEVFEQIAYELAQFHNITHLRQLHRYLIVETAELPHFLAEVERMHQSLLSPPTATT